MHLVIYYEDIDELLERVISVWCELDQSVVNHAIDEWHRLSACVDAQGGHFEHYLCSKCPPVKVTMSKW